MPGRSESPSAERTPAPAGTWLRSRLEHRLDGLAGQTAADHRPATRPLIVGAGEEVVRARLERRFGTCAVADPSDALQLPFDDAAFDLVVCLDVLADLRDPSAGLRELARVSSRHLLLAAPHEPSARVAGLLAGRRPPRRRGTTAHRWTSAGFQRFVSTEASVRSVSSPFPWTLVWATTASLWGTAAPRR
jgi:hypothetical protein